MRVDRLPSVVILAGLAAILAVAAGCRHGAVDARAALTETAAKIGDIRSGELDLGVNARSEDGSERRIELRGPFELQEDDGLPRLRMELTAPGIPGAITVVSNGREVWAEVFGQRFPLDEEQQDQLRRAVAALIEEGRLRALAVHEWVLEPRLTDGGEVGGARTDRIEGDLDVPAVVEDLLDLFGVFGLELEGLDEEDADRLRRAVRSSSFELHTGKDDRLLRRLTIEAELSEDVPADLAELAGTTVTFRLGIANPNQPVEIDDGG